MSLPNPPSIGLSGANWAYYFFGFNARQLSGNSDDAFKSLDEESFGGPTAGAALRDTGLWGVRDRYLHDIVDGSLRLRAYPMPPALAETFFFQPYIAGMISGELSHAQRYGYWETRIKINSLTQGQHLSVWMLANDGSFPPEIDLLECVGQFPTIIFSNSHGPHDGGAISQFTVLPSVSADWHILGFRWTSSRLTWTVDGQIVRQHSNYPLLDGKQMYFLITWEIASFFPGDPDVTTIWPAEVAIDYVRIYADPPLPPVEGTLTGTVAAAITLTSANMALVWSDEFTVRSVGHPDDGDFNWGYYFLGWNFTRLTPNSDDALKTYDEAITTGVTTVRDTLVETGLWGDHSFYLHEVIDGIMYLRAYPTPPLHLVDGFGNIPYITGMLSGELTYGQRYGYWECRLKINSITQGQHLMVSLLPNDLTFNTEIDLLDCIGSEPTTISVNSHGEIDDIPINEFEALPSITADWHVLGFRWTPNTLIWTIDGEIVRQHFDYSPLNTQQLYFAIFWQVANIRGGNPDVTTVWPAEVAVDYVRISADSDSVGGVP